MKKILLVAGIVLLSLTANAQEKSKGLQGVWWAEVQASVSDAKKADNTVIGIVGTFISPDVTVGLGIGNISSTVGGLKSNTLLIEPLVRKYWNVKGNLFFFGQAALPITATTNGINDNKASSIALAVAPGFDYIINKWLTIDASVTLLSVGSTSTTTSGVKTTNLGFNVNSVNAGTLGGVNLGVKFLF